MEFTQTLRLVWNMWWTNASIMKKTHFPRMKDFSPALKCMGGKPSNFLAWKMWFPIL